MTSHAIVAWGVAAGLGAAGYRALTSGVASQARAVVSADVATFAPIKRPPPPDRPRYRAPAPVLFEDAGLLLEDGGEDAVVALRAAARDLALVVEALQAQRLAEEERATAAAMSLEALNDRLGVLQAQFDRDRAERSARLGSLGPALDQLRRVDAILAAGSDDVDDDLRDAESALEGQARDDVGRAREALNNRDLFAARIYTELAMAAVMADQVSSAGQPRSPP